MKRSTKQLPSTGRAAAENAVATTPTPDPLAKRGRAVAEHVHYLLASLYRHQLGGMIGQENPLRDSTVAFVLDLFERLQPRDPLEELLVGQMLVTHVRLLHLSTSAQQQQNLKWAAMMHEAADRAANTYRRQMLALAEYRRPPRPPRSFTAIGQANIAQQQVVQNGKSESDKATNEQG